jgi:acetylornithine deacetylase
LNSHRHGKPKQGYTHDPFSAIEKRVNYLVLGSNDAGGCFVSLLATFVHFIHMKFTL